jgi:two-component system invasion response regulator UvrY
MTTVYLVDDHLVLRQGLQALLEAAGHTVVGGSEDPTRAIAELIRLQPKVLILDLTLDKRSGFELLEDVKRRALPVRTVVLTMSGHPRHVGEAVRLGVSSYLLKGVSMAEVLSAVAHAERGEMYFTAETADLAVKALALGADEPALASLSARERQVITLVVQGHSSAAIGALLHLSPKTVDSYRSRLMAKLGVPDVTALVRLSIRLGLIDVNGA